ncbi:MAG: acyltransferase family protein [Burkholderiales bacterium]|nr:acyltransferase family protein [Burkholderiales bacterium]
MNNEKPARLYALDNLRAIMMWLGIVLHVAALHMSVDRTQLPWIDTQRSPIADLVATSIHAFRMPVFFILAGFFVVMLAQTRGVDAMLKNRVQRLALPFVVFWPVVWLAGIFAGLAYLNRMLLGAWGLDLRVVDMGIYVPKGPNTIHLWFLWQLLWLCVAAALLMRLPRRWFEAPKALLHLLGRRWWGFIVLAIPVGLAGIGSRLGIVEIVGSFLPPWGEWLHSGMFFAFGMMMYGHREEFFAHYREHRLRYALAGLLFYVLTGIAKRVLGPGLVVGYAYACAGWLWSFSLVGYAVVVLAERHRLLGYLADSAYWVYLVHLPLVILFGAVMYEWQVHAIFKMALSIALTTAVCLGSYELFVRHTWVSVLLNGKRHPRRGVPPAAAAAAG